MNYSVCRAFTILIGVMWMSVSVLLIINELSVQQNEISEPKPIIELPNYRKAIKLSMTTRYIRIPTVPPPVKKLNVVTVQGGEDPDLNITTKRNVVKQMMKDAWKTYKDYAWGWNEVSPQKQKPISEPFPNVQMGLTIVDSLTTLYIMGLENEYQEAREWVRTSLKFEFAQKFSLFEMNIRYLGSFLSMYAMTGDVLYKWKASELASLFMEAFDRTNQSLPDCSVVLSRIFHQKKCATSTLAEVGTLQMEFMYLSDITGEPRFKSAAFGVLEHLKNRKSNPSFLLPNALSRVAKTQISEVGASLSGGGDSFYEYLLKVWIQSGKQEKLPLQMYQDMEEHLIKKLLQRSKDGRLMAKDQGKLLCMQHLACFAGGMFALADTVIKSLATPSRMSMAEDLASTCQFSYNSSRSGLGPEKFCYSTLGKYYPGDARYLGRPEAIETWFILWRLTHKSKYREWGWKMVESLLAHSKVKEGGFVGIVDVNNPEKKDAIQRSFFMAETLKYLYLLFSSDDLISLNLWVFNTEAHPLPIKGKNPYYNHSLW